MKFVTMLRLYTVLCVVFFSAALSPVFAVGTPSWSSYKSGTLIASLKDKRLYHIISARKVVTYPIGIPRKGRVRTMDSYVSRKKLRPGWTPTANQRRRDKKLPGYVKGGSSKNPLGAAAIYLGSTVYRIHGTNEPRSIGRSMSDGCVHMRNRDILRLYGKVRHKARVIITWKSYRSYRVASLGTKRAKKKAAKTKAVKRARAKKKANKKAAKAKALKRAQAKKKASKKAAKAKALKRAQAKKRASKKAAKAKALKRAQAKKRASKKVAQAKALKRAQAKKKAKKVKVSYVQTQPAKPAFRGWSMEGELK